MTLRTITKLQHPTQSDCKVIVARDTDRQEYRVTLVISGVKTTYHCDDKLDALSTAKHQYEALLKVIPIQIVIAYK